MEAIERCFLTTGRVLSVNDASEPRNDLENSDRKFCTNDLWYHVASCEGVELDWQPEGRNMFTQFYGIRVLDQEINFMLA